MFFVRQRLVWVSLLALLFSALFPNGPVAAQAKEQQGLADKKPIWRPGLIWRLALTYSRPRAEDQVIEMHVALTGTQTVGGAECWHLEFLPIHAPANLGTGWRVLLEKGNGTLRQIAPRRALTKLLTWPQGLPFPPEPSRYIRDT